MSEKIPSNQEIKKSPEQEIKTIQMSKEQFLEMVYEEGNRVKSSFDSEILEHTYIKKEQSTESVQATYEFNNKLYLIEFDITLGAEQGGVGCQTNLWSYSLKPRNIKLVEIPLIEKVE